MYESCLKNKNLLIILRFYDPSLHYIFHVVLKKSFWQLGFNFEDNYNGVQQKKEKQQKEMAQINEKGDLIFLC